MLFMCPKLKDSALGCFETTTNFLNADSLFGVNHAVWIQMGPSQNGFAPNLERKRGQP